VTEDDMLFLRELSDNLLNLFPDRILLIRRAPEISEKQKKDKKLQSLKVLIVVDEIDPVLKDAIYSTAYSKGKQVQIVLFDRNGYASLAELFDSKLYESGKKRQQDEVYCSGQL
jgi:SpoU rRNA methylase family enzyme